MCLRYLAFYVVVSGIDQRNTCEPQIRLTQYVRKVYRLNDESRDSSGEI